MAYERSWTPEEYQATIGELEALDFLISRPGVMTRADGPIPLVIDLLPHDGTRPGWVRMSVPNGALVNLVKAPQRAAAAEATTALLRQALQEVGIAANDLMDNPQANVVSRADSIRQRCANAVSAANAGQSLLDHIKSLEEQVQQLAAALKPFALPELPYESKARDDTTFYEHVGAKGTFGFTFGDVKRARSVLDKLKEVSTNG